MVRKTQIAREKEENYQFIQCLATPIYKNEKPIFAMSVSVPTFRYTEEKGQQIEKLLLEAKKNLELLYLTGDQTRPRLPSRFLNPLLK